MSQRHSRVTFHHVIGKAAVKGRCYHGLSITRSVQDNQFCAVNPRFIAVVTECTGGGAFVVISVRHTGRVSPLHARVCGHSAPVLDVKWDPFNDLRVASCSEDCTVKVWDIPPNGLKADLKTPSKDLSAHSRRVSIIEWHPTARDLLLSSAYDCREFGCRSHKVSRVLFLWDLKMLVSTGSSCWNQRQFVLWDLEDLSEPLLEEDLDGGSGVIFPFYDADTHMLYLAGKGDANIRYYAVSAVKPYVHFLSEYRSPCPQRGLGVMPKRGLNTSACEIFRFYRLLAVKDLLEPLSFCVPRKQSEGFQEDIYPMTAANEPAMTPDEWLMGQNKDRSAPVGPLLMSLRPAAEALGTCPSETETAADQDAEQPPDIIADLQDWTEDDTQSHDWISSRFGLSRGKAPAPETEVPLRQQEEIQHLQEQLKQRDERIRQLELELMNTRKHMRASF
ncbi:coronin-2B-like isoform X2 [Labeo rohita]|uniref:Coronin n=1 Tax=Labeo rohita TaxID=84645 RepID=A0A498LNY0_LABRO|nr:coronin-2B-like isoform X2 [Labeo rohita]